MAARWMILLGALVMAAAPAWAQEEAPQVPRVYGERDGPERADRGRPPAVLAREEAAAALAEAKCDAGDKAGCGALGKAYLLGVGKPQSRPVAELLLREACTAGDAAACLTLGDLFASITEEDTRRIGAETLARGCELGSLDACAGLADMIDAGIWEDDKPDAATATELRRSACARGGVAACSRIAERQFTQPPSPQDQETGKAALERLCRGGDGNSCAILIDHTAPSGATYGAPPSPYLRQLLDQGCRAGRSEACADLGRAVFLETAGPPETRAAALALLDRACDLAGRECRTVREIRLHPALAASCAAGDQMACVSLGNLYADGSSLLSDPREAARLLGEACEAGRLDACGTAANTLFGGPRPLAAEDAAKVIRWSLAACDGGVMAVCEVLGDRLIAGNALPPDRPRGLTLLWLACDSGRRRACDALEAIAAEDPDAPLPAADTRVLPPMTAEEEEAYRREASAARRAEVLRSRVQSCTTTTVTFRGVTYTDTICTPNMRSIGGFKVTIGEAPWQALLWRPAKLGTAVVGEEYRAACGAAVVATGWILTAAHCLVDHVDGVGKFAIEKSGYRVRLGVTRPLVNEGASYPILRVIPHPLFVRKSLEFDIALVQYDPRAGTRGGGSFPMARIKLDTRSLAERPVVAKAPVFSFGWGRTELNIPQASEVLQGVRLELRDPQECTKVTGFLDKRRDSVLCAAGPKGEQACFGDSGGPLITYRDASGVPTLIGVVSGGVKCGTTGVPSRYTRIGHPLVQAWLASHVPGFRSGRTAR